MVNLLGLQPPGAASQIPTDAGAVGPPAPVNLLDMQPPVFDPRNPAGRPLSDAEWFQQTYGEPYTGHPEGLVDIRIDEDRAGFEAFRRWSQTQPQEDLDPLMYVPERSDTERQLELGIQGVGRGMADIAGAPVDILTLLSNGLNTVLEGAVNWIPGVDVDLGRAQNLPLSSNWIAETATPIAEAFGLEVLDPNEMNAFERLMYNINRFGTQAAVGAIPLARGAMSPNVNPTLNPAARPNRTVEGFTSPYWQNPARAYAGDAAAGAGAGTANFVYEENAAPFIRENYGPFGDAVANIIADILGGIGGVTTLNLAEGVGRGAVNATRNAATGPNDYTLPRNEATGEAFRRREADLAARAVQQAANDPAGAAQTIRTAANAFRADIPSNQIPTTGIMSNDVGLIALENAARRSNNVPFITRDNAVREAAENVARNIAPANATGRQMTEAAENLHSARQVQAQLLAEQFQPTGTPGQAAVDIDTGVTNRLTTLQRENADRFRAVDPDRAAQVDITSVQDLARSIVNDLGQLADPRNIIPAGLLRRIMAVEDTEVRTPVQGTTQGPPGEQVLDPNNPMPRPDNTIDVQAEWIDGDPPQVAIGEIVEIWPELSRTIDRARKAENYTLADNLQALRNEFNRIIDEAAATGDEAAIRAIEAREAWQQGLGAEFGSGAAQRFRRDFNLDRENRSQTPPSQTASRFLRAGHPELAKELRNILGSQGEEAVHQYLVADMARRGVLDPKSGLLRPDRLRQWQEQWGSVIGEVSPRTAKLIDETFRGMDAAGGVDANTLQSEVLRARREIADPEANQGALGFALGNNPVNTIQRIFQSGDPETAIADLMRTLGDNQQAVDGLKAAIREYMIETATTSQVAGTTSGVNPISFASLDNMFKRYEGALAQVFSPEEMHALRQSHALLRPLVNRTQQATTGSPTAERWIDDFWRYAEIGLKARFGILKGGGIMRTLRLAAATFPSSSEGVRQIMLQMYFDPELAAHLLTRPVDEVGGAKWNARLNRLLGVTEGVRQGQYGDPMQIEPQEDMPA